MAIFGDFVNTSSKLFESSLSHKSAYCYYRKSRYLPNWCVVQEQVCYMAFEETTLNGQMVQIKKKK